MVSEWRGHYWTTWNEYLAEAELEYSEKSLRMADAEIFEALAKCIKHYGKWPSPMAMRLYSKNVNHLPGYKTLKLRGDKRTLASQIAIFLVDKPEYADVRQICLSITTESSTKSTISDGAIITGYVYLQKHEKGRYKIGCSGSPNRRAREIGLKLPYRVELVHSIPSVAPSALERYWHLRFDNKHIDGEFFKLNADDVKAFKRRKEDF